MADLTDAELARLEVDLQAYERAAQQVLNAAKRFRRWQLAGDAVKQKEAFDLLKHAIDRLAALRAPREGA